MKPRKSLQDMLRGLSRSFNCATPSGVERHVFQEKTLRKKRLCAACSEPVVSQGSVCRVCKITSHKKCEGKVIPGCSTPPPADMRRRTAPGPSIQHMGSTKSVNIKQRSSLPRNFSLDHVIQRSYDLDLTYITERIISVFFPNNLEEQRYRANLREVASMLKSKHEDKYLLFNLSRKRHDIAKLNPKMQDFFWPDGHAPPLDVICSICKAMEAWLAQDPQHVVVLHCKGNHGKTGVVIASYMHYSKVSASADQALSTLAMRKFCEDKVSVSLHPSQRRYINYFGGLLSGTIKISSDMLSLQCVMLPVIPALQTDGGFCTFLKIYQSMQLVYTSGIYSSHGGTTPQKRQLCISLEPALLLKGDIMVKCYHKRCKPHEREVLFRVQFHTCTIHKTHLSFSKDQLDCAFTDDRFPEDASVEFMFSAGQDKANGREVFSKDPNVSVDYDITDPLVRYDSYENLNMTYEDGLEDLSHTRGPLDGSLYARVKKKVTPVTSSNGSPEQHGRLLSVSSDSGHSSAPTERLEETPQKSLPTATERQDLERLLGGFGVSVKKEAEPHYSQVLKHEEVATQNVTQRQQMEERGLHNTNQEGANQNIQTKINGEVRPPYSPLWPVTPDGGASQCLPLASSCWEGQREAPCETHWNGQREAAILEEEMGQYGELAMYPGRRPLISRHCSCRLGYSCPNIEGPPNRCYFRPEGIIDSRGGAGAGVILQTAHYAGMYGEQERRRLFRSLSEGPQHYPAHAQSPPKRGSLRDTRPYICQPSTHEPLFPPVCPCSHCQNSACYPVTNMQPFHRGELPLHIPQPYGQSVQINHDFPHPFQVPQTKMLYGYPPPHGEEHFNHFTEGGYGHTYPHFLNPSYLPPHCPPNGYGPHSFPNSISPYSPPRGQSPPSGSVSPANLSAPRRMSGDTISASSVSELTSVEQQQQDEPSDCVVKLQLHKNMETGPAVSSSAIVQRNSSAQGSPQQPSSPMDTHITRSSDINMHVHSSVQANQFVHPQSPVHTSTPINTPCQSIQTNNLVNVQNPTLQGHSVTQTSPTSPTPDPRVQNPTLPGHNQGQTSPTSLRTAPPVQMQNPSLQSHSQGQTCPTMHVSAPPVYMQTPALQSHSQGQTYATSPTHAPSIHVHKPTLQSPGQGQTCPTSTPHIPAVHTQNPAFQSQRLGQASPTHSPSPQTGHTTQIPSPAVQLNGSSQHMSLSVQGHGQLHSPDQHGQVQDSVPTRGLTANRPLNTTTSPERPDIPNHTQNTCTQLHNPPLPSEAHVQTGNNVVKQMTSSYPHSPNHSQSSQGQAPVPPAFAPTQPNGPQQKLVQCHSSVSTNSSSVKPHVTVHTQSQLVQTDTSVGTQIPPKQLHHPMPKPSQVHTVHTQSPTVQLYRTIGGQCSSVQTQNPAPTHADTNSAAVTERPGLAASHVNTAPSSNEANTLLRSSSSPTHVTKVVLPVPVTSETRRIHSTFGPTVSSTSGTIAFGSSYSSQSFSVPKITVPLQKKSVTISLPVSPVNPQGKEAPTSPPKSPMGSQSDLLPPSPTPSFPIRTAYYSSSPCPPSIQPPQLPEKCHSPAEGEKAEVNPNGLSECNKGHSSPVDNQQDAPVTGNFVQDFSKLWYKPTISREQAIAILRGAEPGSFLIRDSNSFRGAYGLALKVSSPPPNLAVQPYKGDSAEQLVRHFLIETGPKGVKIKGSPIEPHFGSLSALVSQHSVTPLSLPCRLHIPSCDLVEQSSEVMVPTNMSTAADLLRQGAACSVLYLGSVDTESLTGPQAISRASNAILTPPRSSATTVHFKVSDQGITLTDSQRKLFFRRHYPVSSVTFCSSDPQDRRWTNPDRTTSKLFGFVARKAGTAAENVCHLFAELDPEQPASAIVNFITKVMLGAHKR